MKKLTAIILASFFSLASVNSFGYEMSDEDLRYLIQSRSFFNKQYLKCYEFHIMIKV